MLLFSIAYELWQWFLIDMNPSFAGELSCYAKQGDITLLLSFFTIKLFPSYSSNLGILSYSSGSGCGNIIPWRTKFYYPTFSSS